MSKEERERERERLLEAKWKAVDEEPNILDFTATPGIQVEVPDEPSEVEFGNLFFTDELFDLLVIQTFICFTQYIRDHPNLSVHSQARSWHDTTREEIKKFIALPLLDPRLSSLFWEV